MFQIAIIASLLSNVISYIQYLDRLNNITLGAFFDLELSNT